MAKSRSNQFEDARANGILQRTTARARARDRAKVIGRAPDLPLGTEPVTTLAPSVSPELSRLASLTHTHVRYDEWAPVWKRLGHLYEGDGPYLDGTALVPHTRELLYKTVDGVTDFSEVVGEKRKFTQRKAIARYENWASAIVDLYVHYQYVVPIERRIGDTLDGKPHPLQDWWRDVDGMGTPIDEWLRQHQTMTDTYGALFVLMDRLPVVTRRFNVTPEGQKTLPLTLADLGRPVLRRYAPPDALDWLAPRNHLAAVKFVEPVERVSLMDPVPQEDHHIYFLWDRETFQVYDRNGLLLRTGRHFMGDLPVYVWFAQRRAKYPVIGRGLFRDGTLFHDHYNLISELRELFRTQTFSMLEVRLAENETVQEAKSRLGDHAGADSLIFTKGGAGFIAPPSGPAADYAAEIQAVERKMFRLCYLPYDTDSRDAESAESRRRKASDLHASLSSLATHAQALDQWIARMWFQATFGSAEAGRAAFEDAQVLIRHPDTFDVTDMVAKAQDLKSVIDVGIGPTATKLLRLSLVKTAMPDLDEATLDTIEIELNREAERDVETAEATLDALKNPQPKPGAGAPGAGGPPRG